MTVYGYLLGFIKVKHFFYKKSCKQKCFFFLQCFPFSSFYVLKPCFSLLNFILFYPSNLFIVLYYFKVTLPLLFHKQEIKKYTFQRYRTVFFLIFKERKQLFSLTKKIFFMKKD